jgi:hypothetical protein
MKKLLVLFLLFLSFHSWGQKYAYQFKGTLNFDQQKELTTLLEELHYFEQVKLRLKDDSGELLFIIPTVSQRSEEDAPYGLPDVKKYLIQFGLAPQNVVELAY